MQTDTIQILFICSWKQNNIVLKSQLRKKYNMYLREFKIAETKILFRSAGLLRVMATYIHTSGT